MGAGALALKEAELRERLAQVFARQDFLEACKRRDAGAMVRILGSHGITQGQLAALTGLTQVTLSRYATGKNEAKYASTFESFADGMGMPLRLRQALGLTGDTSPDNAASGTTSLVDGVPADTFDLLRLTEAIGRNGVNVNRRDLLTAAAALGASAAITHSEAWERLAYALTNPSALSESAVKQVEARTAGFHFVEPMVPNLALLKGLTMQLNEISTLLGGTASDEKDPLRNRLLITAGESAVLAGWSASNAGDTGAARNWYDTAAAAAREAEDPAIVACALAYRSYIPSAKGANGRARVLLADALNILSGQADMASPGTTAWISAMHAVESAQLGDARQALTSWKQAEEAFSVADPEEDRIWTHFLDQNRFDSYHIATYSRIGRIDEAQEVATSVIARLGPQDQNRKKAVIIFEDIARAHLTRGAITEASKLAKTGIITLREIGFFMWLPKYEAITQALKPHSRQPAVRAYLEEFAITKRQYPSQR
jgi:transcriptional regulator with XRE-family HTH domain